MVYQGEIQHVSLRQLSTLCPGDVALQARVEGNPQNMAQFRVTVSSPAPPLSAQIKDLVVAYLRAAAA
jgi:hypothetical protein